MRVDFVITELFVGGAERCLTELAVGLAKAGDHVRVFSIGSLPQGEQGVLVERLRRHGITIDSADANSLRQAGTAYQKLKRWFRDSRPDVCQCFLFHANVIGAWAARAARVPRCVSGLRVAESKTIRCAIERTAIRRMDRVICVSQGVREFAKSRLHTPEEKLAVIPNGVDIARFETASEFDWTTLDWPANSVVSLYVGRLHPQKGLERLQRQIETIAPTESNRKLLIVGDGPLRSDLSRWADRMGRQRVQLLGWMPKVESLMRASRVLLLPSHYEGMPNAAMEAMAAGRPVICSRVEGSDELFSHRPNEQTVDPQNDQQWKDLIESFLLDEAWSDQIGLENQARVRQDFSLEAMISAYRHHYRELVDRRLD